VKLAPPANPDLVRVMDAKLIFDVGAADGADSAYYLHKGFRVVAVEANPDAAALLRRRFAAELAAGRLTLVEAAISDREGEASTVRFDALLREHGIPHYCKIDIEGADCHCLAALRPDSRPPYISVEMDHEEGDRDLETLRALGYRRFKLVSQASRAQPLRGLLRLGARLPRRLKSRLLRLESWLRGRTRDDDWRFAPGSSGPFGEGTPGPWRGWSEVHRDWQLLNRLAKRHSHLGDWFDIHAAV
jgi:hypothetical protein